MYSSIVVLAACAGFSAAATTREIVGDALVANNKCVVAAEDSTLALGSCFDVNSNFVFVTAEDGYLKTEDNLCIGKIKVDDVIVPGLVECADHEEATWTNINGKWLFSNCKYIMVKDGKLVFTTDADNAVEFGFNGDVPSAMKSDSTPKACSCESCPADSVCRDGACVRACECGEDRDCGYGQLCNKGWCQYDLWCTSNKQCGSNYFCDTKAGRCVAKEITCDWPYKFNGYYCVLPTLECSCNNPCPSNQWCYYGKCIEGDVNNGNSTVIPRPPHGNYTH